MANIINSKYSKMSSLIQSIHFKAENKIHKEIISKDKILESFIKPIGEQYIEKIEFDNENYSYINYYKNPSKNSFKETTFSENKIVEPSLNDLIKIEENKIKPKGYIKKKKDLTKMTFKKYSERVGYYSRKNPYLQTLENYGNKDYQLDHKISRFFGYKHNIPFLNLCCIENLQYIHKDVNINKSYMSLLDESNKHIIENVIIKESFKNTFLSIGYDESIDYYKILHPNKVDRFRHLRNK